MPPLRVGLLHFTAPPIVGGVEAIVGFQAAALRARGHAVTILAGRGKPDPESEFCHLAALDSKFPALLELNQALKRGAVPEAFAELQAHLERALEPLLAGLDVCIVHNAHTLHFNLPLTAALHRLAERAAICPLIAWCHDLSWSNPLYLPLMREEYPWDLLKQMAPRTTYVVVSEDRRQDLARLSGADPAGLTVIPAGVDLNRKWGLGRSTRRLLDEFGLLQADPFMLLPVRITRRKNIEFAIQVTAALRQEGAYPKLLVTGPRGPHDPASMAYVRELQAVTQKCAVEQEVVLLQVDRPGRQPWRPSDPMMDELYRAADLMLMPSAQEGFGIPVIEAGLVGLPIFCSNIPPFREIAQGHASFFELDESPRAVAANIRAFIRKDGRYQLRKRVARDFNWETIFDRQLVPLLRSVSVGGGDDGD